MVRLNTDHSIALALALRRIKRSDSECDSKSCAMLIACGRFLLSRSRGSNANWKRLVDSS